MAFAFDLPPTTLSCATTTAGSTLPAPRRQDARATATAPRLALRAPNRSVAGMDQPVAGSTDDALMLAWAAGDAGAFEVLYARHRGPLFHFLLGQLRDRPLAEEIYQDVWQRVIAARAGWRPDAAFATWLYRIAHNRLNDHWRAQRHRPPAPVDADNWSVEIWPDPQGDALRALCIDPGDGRVLGFSLLGSATAKKAELVRAMEAGG